MGVKPFRKFNLVDMYAFKAEGALARLAVEMHMVVFHVACPVAHAQLIVEHTTSVFKGMHNVMLMEKSQHSENARFVHLHLHGLNVGKTCRVVKSCQRLVDQNTVGGWLYALVLQSFDYLFTFHLIS